MENKLVTYNDKDQPLSPMFFYAFRVSFPNRKRDGHLPLSLNVVKSSESSWCNSVSAAGSENKTTTVSLGYYEKKQCQQYFQVEAEMSVHWPVHLPLMHLPMI